MDEMLNLYENLNLTAQEKAVANTVMLYLLKVGGVEARRVMLPVVDVKMYQLEVENTPARSYKATPVNSVIDGKALAAVIDAAVADSMKMFEDGWLPEEPEGIAEKNTVLGNLGAIKGAEVVQNMDEEFAEFVVRCGRWVRTLK